jgi:hypothetical protein
MQEIKTHYHLSVGHRPNGRRKFWAAFLLCLFGTGWLAMPTSAMAGGGGAGAAFCTPIIAKYGCLAQAFGCHPAPPYPCNVFDSPQIQQAIKKVVVETVLNVITQLILDGKVDWKRSVGDLKRKFPKISEIKVPQFGPSLPYQVPPDDPTKASSDPDEATRKANNLFFSYVSPLYPTRTIQERQQLNANLQDAIGACATRLFGVTVWAQLTLVDFYTTAPTVSQLMKKGCPKDAGSVNCHLAVKNELEKQSQQADQIMQVVENEKKECDALKDLAAINTREKLSPGTFITK